MAVSFADPSATGRFDNTIIWDNSGGVSLGGVTPTGSCNDTQDGSLAGIQADPDFVTTSRGSFRLGPSSPAVDACNAGPAHDLDNAGRPTDGDGSASPAEYDMGAFEREEFDPDTFSDGFESGDTAAWSSSVP